MNKTTKKGNIKNYFIGGSLDNISIVNKPRWFERI